MWAKLNANLERISEKKWLATAMKWFMWMALALYLVRFAMNELSFPFIFKHDSSFDSLFNYSGGFIRRGLTGSLLLWLYEAFGVNPLVSLKCLCLACYLFVAAYFVRQFARRGFNWYLLLTCYMLGGVSVYLMEHLRRDFVMIALLIAIFHFYNRLSLKRWLLLGNVLCCLALLSHEAFFFYSVPLLVLATRVKCGSWLRAALCWAPSAVVFVVCCLFKGTPEQKEAICDSVRMFFPDPNRVPWPFEYIGDNGQGMILSLMEKNFISNNGLTPIVNAVSLWAVYYVSIYSVPTLSPNSMTERGRGCLVRLVQMQWICMLPMLIVLFIDYSRVAMFWIMSAYIAWFSMTEEQMESLLPRRLDRLCMPADRALTLGLHPCKALCWLLLLTVGVTTLNPAIETSWANSILFQVFYQPYYAIKDLLMAM